MDQTVGCMDTKVKIVNVDAFNSKTFTWNFRLTDDHVTLVLRPWKKSPHISSETSEATINWETLKLLIFFWSSKGFAFANLLLLLLP